MQFQVFLNILNLCFVNFNYFLNTLLIKILQVLKPIVKLYCLNIYIILNYICIYIFENKNILLVVMALFMFAKMLEICHQKKMVTSLICILNFQKKFE